MTLQNKYDRDTNFSVRLSRHEVDMLEKLAKVEERSASDTLRICFIREARVKLPQSVWNVEVAS